MSSSAGRAGKTITPPTLKDVLSHANEQRRVFLVALLFIDNVDERLPGSVLFCCTMNSVRSPMAEGILKALYPKQVFVDSVGVRQQAVDPIGGHEGAGWSRPHR